MNPLMLTTSTVAEMARKRSTQATGLVVRSNDELLDELRKQFELLKSACNLYDAGDGLQVLNVAARLRVILNPPNSLINKLHLQRQLNLRDTSTHRLDPDRHMCIANVGVEISHGDCARWVPLLDGWPPGHPVQQPQRFGIWWNEPIMPRSVQDGLDRTPRYSRRDLVLGVANKDGGTHVDNRDVDYDSLTRDSFSMEVAFKDTKGQSEFMPIIGNPVDAAVRQIGHEVLVTLSLDLPDVMRSRDTRK
jgi:hypothetical protein